MYSSQQANKPWKAAFLILSAFILIIMPLLSRSYGQTGDEWLQMEYGRDIWNYFFNNNPQALDYSAGNLQHQKQELYGGLFDFGTEIVHQWLPGIPHLVLRHFFNALSGAVFMIFTGLLAYRLSRRWSVGVIALLFIFFSPRIFGESMNNPKDIPFACGFIAGIYFLVALLQDYPRKKWLRAIGLAVGFGIAFGVRAAGGALQIAYFIVFAAGYYLMDASFKARIKNDGKMMKSILLIIGGALVAGYILGLVFWPYGLQSPISHTLESLAGMANRETNIRVLFEGKYYMAHYMPWYYEFKWIFISNPLVIIIGFLLFAVLSISLMKAYGKLVVLFLVFGALFPILYMIYKNSTVYDTWRHVFFVYPFWVMMAAFGWSRLGDFIGEKLDKKAENAGRERYIGPALALLGLTPAIIWTVRSHPNQYVYFNELVGGAHGAYGSYDLDYYQNSGLQAADWIKRHAARTPGKKLVVTSNMSGYSNYFVGADTAIYHVPYVRYGDRHSKDWDYYVATPRFLPAEQLQQDIWPPQNVVHRVEVDGRALCVILRRQSKEGIEASKAMEAKDFPTAARLYSNYIKTDTTDEFALVNYGIALASSGQIDPAISALQRATRLQPANAQFYEILAQLYAAKGDAAGAQQAKGKAQAIMAEEVGNMPEE
jgi:tetratricopeptide (TPR) repeat protein